MKHTQTCQVVYFNLAFGALLSHTAAIPLHSPWHAKTVRARLTGIDGGYTYLQSQVQHYWQMDMIYIAHGLVCLL